MPGAADTNSLPGTIRGSHYKGLLSEALDSGCGRIPVGNDGRSAASLEGRSVRNISAQTVGTNERDPNCERRSRNAGWLCPSFSVAPWSLWLAAEAFRRTLGTREGSKV